MAVKKVPFDYGKHIDKLKKVFYLTPEGQLARVGKTTTYCHPQNKHGYSTVSMSVGLNLSVMLYTQRVIYMLAHGDIPEGYEIDHKDGVRHNNWLSNLRLATRGENSQNKVGTSGVYKYPDSRRGMKKFAARIHVGGKKIHLGDFMTKEEAHDAYNKAKEQLHTHGRITNE